MKRRFVQIEGTLQEVSEDDALEPRAGIQFIPDIKPYRSMIDGTMITSRSQHREHLREHGCVEVGNDASLGKQKPPLASPAGMKERIARLVYSKLRY